MFQVHFAFSLTDLGSAQELWVLLVEDGIKVWALSAIIATGLPLLWPLSVDRARKYMFYVCMIHIQAYTYIYTYMHAPITMSISISVYILKPCIPANISNSNLTLQDSF